MRWAHVRFHLDNKKVNIPISFIENFDKMEICVNQNYYVFWSPLESDTPESILAKEKRILYVEKIKKSTKKIPLAGWYNATVLLLAGKYTFY